MAPPLSAVSAAGLTATASSCAGKGACSSATASAPKPYPKPNRRNLSYEPPPYLPCLLRLHPRTALCVANAEEIAEFFRRFCQPNRLDIRRNQKRPSNPESPPRSLRMAAQLRFVLLTE